MRYVRSELQKFRRGKSSEDGTIIEAAIDAFNDVIIESRRADSSPDLFSKVKINESSGDVLIIRVLLRDEVSRRLDQGLLDVGSLDLVIERQVALDLYL